MIKLARTRTAKKKETVVISHYPVISADMEMEGEVEYQEPEFKFPLLN